MSNSNLYLEEKECQKQIEDIIDVRKKKGQYNIHKNLSSEFVVMPASVSESDLSMYYPDEIHNLTNSLGPTDSEVTVVRVKREGMQFKHYENRWNLKDDAVPGDGSHLADSPSMVNLVTLVGETFNATDDSKGYLVPISSWEPGDHPHQLTDFADDYGLVHAKETQTTAKLKTLRKRILKKCLSSSIVPATENIEKELLGNKHK